MIWCCVLQAPHSISNLQLKPSLLQTARPSLHPSHDPTFLHVFISLIISSIPSIWTSWKVWDGSHHFWSLSWPPPTPLLQKNISASSQEIKRHASTKTGTEELVTEIWGAEDRATLVYYSKAVVESLIWDVQTKTTYECLSSRPGSEPAWGLQYCLRHRPYTVHITRQKELEAAARQGRLLRIEESFFTTLQEMSILMYAWNWA